VRSVKRPEVYTTIWRVNYSLNYICLGCLSLLLSSVQALAQN